jgi:uncharacterized C2H2 Zn-finger protein
MARDPLRTLESLVSERLALARKEGRLIEALNRVLHPAGLVVTSVSRVDGSPRRPSVVQAATPAREALKCPRCSRRFTRAMHLGRHLAASHARRAARRTAPRRKAVKRGR